MANRSNIRALAALWPCLAATPACSAAGSSAAGPAVHLPPLLHRAMAADPAGGLGFALLALACAAVLVAVRRVRRNLRRERQSRFEAQRALEQSTRVEALATALSKARTTAEVARAALSELAHDTGAAAGAVLLVNDGGTRLEVAEAVGYADGETAARYAIPLADRTVLTEALRRRHSVTFASGADSLGPPALAVDSLLSEGEGAMGIPLVVSGSAVGVIALSFTGPHEPDGTEQELLAAAQSRIALALDRARRYELAERARAEAEALRVTADVELRERQRAEAALRESEARYRALAVRTNRLYTLSAALSEAITLDAVARIVVRHGKFVAGASAGSVALLAAEGAEFQTLYAEEYAPQIIEALHRFAAEPGLCATTAVQTRRPVYVGSFAEWQQQYPRSASTAADGGYASGAVLPLLVEGAPIGVLSFHFTAPVNFDEGYRALLSSVAQHAAQTIDRARLYETAQRARADAEAANRAKDDFLSIVSHELRTPLSAVLGWAAMLRDEQLDPARVRRAIEAIYGNATRQAHLIDELLDVSRIVGGRAPLDTHELDLAATVRGAVEAILPTAEARGVHLHVEPLPADVRLVADPRRLEQVFLNLLGNAVKFTPAEGRVTVGVDVCERQVEVRVADTGRGIDPVFLPHVFERFRQADGSAARSAGGLGLGLFIAHRLVEAHGGSIRAESEGEGRGATFTVTLPAAIQGAVTTKQPEAAPGAAATPAPTAPLPSLAGIRVLLVDDEADVRDMMASVLETCGATVLSAGSTQAALDVLKADRARVDVLLADIAMPGRDGCDLIREVRSEPRTARLPAAAVTACARADERQRVLANGFQMHLAKPVTPAELANAVAALAHVPHATAQPPW